MKNINQYIQESILDDEEDIIKNDDFLIKQWLKDNYKTSWNASFNIDNNIINVEGDIIVKNKKINQLLPGNYKFGQVTGNFECSDCSNLKSLEGCPEVVKGYFKCCGCNKLKNLIGSPSAIGYYFNCSYCKKLETLEGAPNIVFLSFDCSCCPNLKSLEGSPNKVGGDFFCYYCDSIENLKGMTQQISRSILCNGCPNLKSLEGCPDQIKRFDCSTCKKLKTLKGCPKHITDDFLCFNCGAIFDREYIKSITNVDGKVYN